MCPLELKSVYNVPYLIWSNYELNKEASPKETSICYLANIIFKKCIDKYIHTCINM